MNLPKRFTAEEIEKLYKHASYSWQKANDDPENDCARGFTDPSSSYYGTPRPTLESVQAEMDTKYLKHVQKAFPHAEIGDDFNGEASKVYTTGAGVMVYQRENGGLAGIVINAGGDNPPSLTTQLDRLAGVLEKHFAGANATLGETKARKNAALNLGLPKVSDWGYISCAQHIASDIYPKKFDFKDEKTRIELDNLYQHLKECCAEKGVALMSWGALSLRNYKEDYADSYSEINGTITANEDFEESLYRKKQRNIDFGPFVSRPKIEDFRPTMDLVSCMTQEAHEDRYGACKPN